MAKKKTKKETFPEMKKAPAIGVINFGKVTATIVIYEDSDIAEVTMMKNGQTKKIQMDLTEV